MTRMCPPAVPGLSLKQLLGCSGPGPFFILEKGCPSLRSYGTLVIALSLCKADKIKDCV